MRDIQQTDLIADHTIDIFDSSPAVAEAVRSLNPRKVTLFLRDKAEAVSIEGVTISDKLTAVAASMTSADVCMLDGLSLKVLAVRYPSDAQYLLARIAPRWAWGLGSIGLMRRLLLGRIKLGGIIRLRDSNNKNTYWLLINRTRKTVPGERLLLPKKVGPTAFFDWMRKENINYVVPRFYETLPELHREDGDLDLLVANEDVERVEEHIRGYAGELTGTTADSIPIGMHSVSRSLGVPYYPPPLAKQILERAVDGPAGSRIPEATDALNAFIYHTLYHHKGYSTNIPSTLDGKPEHTPDNDYGGIIQKKASALGIEVGHTMEELDEYMARVGWQPKRDTLAKIANKNAWVRDRFFSDSERGSTGLAVFILKERVLERGIMDDVVAHMREAGLIIIRTAVFNETQKRFATDHVRGGNWSDSSGSTKGWLPAAIVIAIDPKCTNLPAMYSAEYERTLVTRRKYQIRHAFDEAGELSMIHSADNTVEAWDYIETCFHDDLDKIREEVESKSQLPLLVRITRYLSPAYVGHVVRYALRDFVTKRLL